jgi:cell division protein FtsI/penicillin-binding protein 2
MRQAFRLKLRVFSGLVVCIALLIIARLYFLQIVDGEEYLMRAERQYESREQVFDRGNIYFSRKDDTLISAATVASGFRIALDARALTDSQKAYESLSSVLPLKEEDFFPYAEDTEDPYEVLAVRVSKEAGEAIVEMDIPGIIVEHERWRAYPAGTKAAPTVGFVAFDDENQITGRYGLERYYEETLSRKESGLFGNFFAQLFANLESVTGDARHAKEGDLVTSIEPMVQEKLGQVLEEVTSTYGSSLTGGIIMDPATGEIVAMDTNPTFDPNDFRSSDPNRFGNPLVEHVYEFGSIMKALTMTAGLDAGVISPSSTYEDTGCTTVSTKRFCNHDLKARGTTGMQDVLSHSLNLGVAHIAKLLGHDTFREYFSALGFGTETGIDLPSEVRGQMKNLDGNVDVEFATASFGQGIAVSPIEMIRALGALAHGGEIVTPHLVKAIRLENGIEKKISWGESERVFAKESVEETTRMLVKVVDEALAGGTVKIEEMSVAAKTGTAQVAGPAGGYEGGKYFHSFFGYFPAFSPRYIILLYTREPQGVQYASETLTHPFMDLAEFLISYYDIPPDRAPAVTTPAL